MTAHLILGAIRGTAALLLPLVAALALLGGMPHLLDAAIPEPESQESARPLPGWRMPQRHLSRVLLPAPEGPTMAARRPGPTCSEIDDSSRWPETS